MHPGLAHFRVPLWLRVAVAVLGIAGIVCFWGRRDVEPAGSSAGEHGTLDSPEARVSDSLAAAWTFIRGQGYDGHSSEIGLADEWPAAGPPVLWARSLGQGYSAFVAAGRR